jgi:hypothetical protein
MLMQLTAAGVLNIISGAGGTMTLAGGDGGLNPVSIFGGSPGVAITSSKFTVGTATNNQLMITAGGNSGNNITFNRSGTGGMTFYSALTFVSPPNLNGGIGVWGQSPGSLPASKPTVSGSRTDGTALTSLLTTMASYGFFVDSTVA